MSFEQRPTVRSRSFGMMLRQLRIDRGLSTHAAARLLNRSQASISQIETGHRGIRRPALENMLDRYGVQDPALRETLFRLAKECWKKGWWQSYDDTLSPEAMDLIGLEADATAMKLFEVIFIPGLFQTEAYARAIIGIGQFAHDLERVERLVRVRIMRQKILTRSEPPEIHAIVDEAALHRQVGGPEVMNTQLRQLLKMARLSTLTLQVLPFGAGAYNGMAGPFMIFDVGEHGDLRIVATDSMGGMSYQEADPQVRGYSEAFDQLQRSALSENDSRALIRRLVCES